MKYRVVWDGKALEDLREPDKQTATKIFVRVGDHLAQDPHHIGKALTGQEIIITIVRVFFRRDAYV